MPPQGSVMGGRVWPQWEALWCCVPHIHSGGNMRATGASVYGVSLSEGRDRVACEAVTSSLGISPVFPWQPGGDPPRYHCPLLDPFVNISLHWLRFGVNIGFFFLPKQSGLATKEEGQIYTHDVCLCPTETVTSPQQVDVTNRSFIRALSPNNGSDSRGEVSQLKHTKSVTKSAAGSIWRPLLSPGCNVHTHTDTHAKCCLGWHFFYQALISLERGVRGGCNTCIKLQNNDEVVRAGCQNWYSMKEFNHFMLVCF